MWLQRSLKIKATHSKSTSGHLAVYSTNLPAVVLFLKAGILARVPPTQLTSRDPKPATDLDFQQSGPRKVEKSLVLARKLRTLPRTCWYKCWKQSPQSASQLKGHSSICKSSLTDRVCYLSIIINLFTFGYYKLNFQ